MAHYYGGFKVIVDVERADAPTSDHFTEGENACNTC